MKKLPMQKIFRLDSTITKVHKDEGNGSLKISGYASTSHTDRAGDQIPPDAWMKGGLDNYEKNPILLFNHKYDKPIGKTTKVTVDGTGLHIEAEISKSAEIYSLIEDEVLRTFSVGFMIKDLAYLEATDGYVIKDAELLEVSVVSVPCNQDATFTLSKSFSGSEEELEEFVDKKLHNEEVKTEPAKVEPVTLPEGTTRTQEKSTMTPEEIAALAADAAEKAVTAERNRVTKAAEDAAAKIAEEARVTKAAEVAAASTEERLMAEVKSAVDAAVKGNSEGFEEKIKELTEGLAARETEMKAFRNSKIEFGDRTGSGTEADAIKAFEPEVEDAFFLARALGGAPGQKNWNTNLGKSVLEKVNAHSTVTVGSDALETSVGTNLEREMWNDLILAPMFREINMNSATMTIPMMPDAGYAEITANTTASGTQPNGNMDRRGAPYGAPYEGITLTDITLRTIKMIALSFLGNETEEDSIIPILPLIKEAMMRSHQRGVENMFLAGNDVDGVYTSGAVDGLIKIARTGGRLLTSDAPDTTLTAAGLLSMRRAMGKYGLKPQDLIYVVSQHAYFDLMQDAEFQDADLVGANNAVKLTGEVGLLYGSRVVICDEFAAPAPNKVHALALNRRNFVVPRLRGVTVESDYEVREQRRVLVTSQRLGFNEIQPAATSVIALKYAA